MIVSGSRMHGSSSSSSLSLDGPLPRPIPAKIRNVVHRQRIADQRRHMGAFDKRRMPLIPVAAQPPAPGPVDESEVAGIAEKIETAIVEEMAAQIASEVLALHAAADEASARRLEEVLAQQAAEVAAEALAAARNAEAQQAAERLLEEVVAQQAAEVAAEVLAELAAARAARAKAAGAAYIAKVAAAAEAAAEAEERERMAEEAARDEEVQALVSAAAMPRQVLPAAPRSWDFSTMFCDSVFDHVRDGRPEATVKQLTSFLRTKNGESEERIAEMVAKIDVSGDGTIDKEEWRRAWAIGLVSDEGLDMGRLEVEDAEGDPLGQSAPEDV